MMRILAALFALGTLVAAAPAQLPPPRAERPAASAREQHDRNQKVDEAIQRRWDAWSRKTMKHICAGC
jgi:hypothetical protein